MSKVHLVTGGCGFVGRNVVRWILNNTDDFIIIVDDLSFGIHPENWCNSYSKRVLFIEKDIRRALKEELSDFSILKKINSTTTQFSDVFHFAAIVGGRELIENDPIRIATDLSIDAEFFQWVAHHRPDRVLYPSSSAAYPIELQNKGVVDHALKESDIDFNYLRKPDLTYGWNKLTGEILAQITSKKYGVHITCIRPFSGYGPDQDFSYPVPALARRFVNRENPIEVWGDGNQKRDFIFISDLIEGMQRAMDKISDGSAINLGSGVPVSFNEVIKLLEYISGYSPDVKKLLHKPVGVHNRFADVVYSEKLLNWSPKITLHDGLNKVYEYLSMGK